MATSQTTVDGGIPPPSRQRAWPRFHPLTLLVGLLLQLHLAYLLGVDHMNPVPAPADLVQMPVEVLQVQDRVPHLRVRLADDSERSVEFPASAAWLAPTHTPLEMSERGSLQGCMGYVLGVPVRWVQDERFRIWELHCGPVHRVFSEFQAAYEETLREAQRALEWHGGVILLLTVLMLWLERRTYRRRGWL